MLTWPSSLLVFLEKNMRRCLNRKCVVYICLYLEPVNIENVELIVRFGACFQIVTTVLAANCNMTTVFG